METEEMTLKADGIYCRLKLIAKKTKKRSKENRNITPGMFLNDIIVLEKNRGKLEIFLGEGAGWRKKGTFIREYRDIESEAEAYGETYTELRSKNMIIGINEKMSDFGYKETEGIMKTRNHWYEKWKETELKNISITSAGKE